MVDVLQSYPAAEDVDRWPDEVSASVVAADASGQVRRAHIEEAPTEASVCLAPIEAPNCATGQVRRAPIEAPVQPYSSCVTTGAV